MRRSRAKEPKTRPCTSSRSVEVIGTVALEVRNLRQVDRVHQHQAGQRAGDDGQEPAGRGTRCCLPASWAPTRNDLADESPQYPEDGACPINEGIRLIRRFSASGYRAPWLVDHPAWAPSAAPFWSSFSGAGGDHDIRGDGFVLDLLPQRRSILGHGKNQRSAIRKLHGFLHRTFPEGAVTHHVGPLVIENRRGDNLAGAGGAMVHQDHQRSAR